MADLLPRKRTRRLYVYLTPDELVRLAKTATDVKTSASTLARALIVKGLNEMKESK